MVAWDVSGEPVPDVLVEVLGAAALAVGLESSDVEQTHAWQTPDAVRVGWDSLAKSRLFQSALQRCDAGASWIVYADLQQCVASGLSALGSLRDQIFDGLGLRRFGWLLLRVYPVDGGWRSTGWLSTSGDGRGLPGLLTTTTRAAIAPARDPRSTLQLEVLCKPSALRRLVRAVVYRDGGSSLLETTMNAPLRAVLQLTRHLDGRVSLMASDGDLPAFAAGISDEDGVRHVLDEWPMLPTVEIDDGWLLAGPGADVPPELDETEPGPWLHLWWAVPRDDGSAVDLELKLRRAAEDLIRIDATVLLR